MDVDDRRVAVFASGRGSNFQAILKKIHQGYIHATIGLCITNNPKAGVIDIARENDIPVGLFIPSEYPDANTFNDAILAELERRRINFIILAGYLKLIGVQIVKKFSNRIINIHPALLPSFGGKGMYGHHVHDAVFERGVKVSGATVHLVNTEYDAGPIVMQKCVSVGNAKSAEEIARMVLHIEHQIFPEAVKLLVENRLKVNGKRVEILGE
jgi:formyltetrahydrofolate-dependent phosphoribosylglycinamide formyltransferase